MRIGSSLDKVSKALQKASRLETQARDARDELLLACQELCDFELTHCEWDNSEGFVVGFYREGEYQEHDPSAITVPTLLRLASTVQGRLDLDDMSDPCL